MMPDEPKPSHVLMTRHELLWGVILYGIIMWTAGFVWGKLV